MASSIYSFSPLKTARRFKTSLPSHSIERCIKSSFSSSFISSSRHYLSLSCKGIGSRESRSYSFPKFLSTFSKMKEFEISDPVQRRLMLEDECILLNENDDVVGHDSKYNCHLMEKIENENLLHRAFSVFLFNSKNELLIQQRSATKVTFPLVWTNSCCSHPLYRESELEEKNELGVKRAAQRKLFDELGIQEDQLPLDLFNCLGRIHYKAASNGQWGEHEIDYILFFKGDVLVNPNPDEVASVKYMDQDQVKDLIKRADGKEEGIILSPWFRLIVEKSLFQWWDALQNGSLSKVVDMKTIHRF